MTDPAANRRPRIAVFTGDLSYSVRRNIVELDERLGGADWLVLVHSPPRKVGRLIRNQRINLKKNGWRWIPYQGGELLAKLLGSTPLPPAGGEPGGEFSSKALAAKPNVQLRTVPDVHGVEGLAALQAFAPDLGLSLAAPILKPSVFEQPRLGTINLHKGRLPGFRGMPPAFWELWSGQTEVGCSVHRVNAQLDEGELLAETTVPCERFSTPRGVQVRLDEVGVDLVCETAVALLSGCLPSVVQPTGEGRTWRKPTLAQVAELERRLDARLPARGSAARQWVKDLVARAGFEWFHRIGWRLARPRITVILYHRVTDEARDNLSVGVEQFDRQMQLLRRYCEVLSLEQVLAAGTLQRSRRPRVAVTFDDGYLDNATLAAPVLRRHQVPCAFFVSTGLIGTQRQFPHDVRRGYPAIALMDWGHLREMRQQGFVIGSHTVEHIDCVAESAERVKSELSASRADLERELGPGSWVLGYPYGGRHQMNAERLQFVRDAGYVGCLAAYGGTNIGAVDRWNVQRRGVDWTFSDACFLWTCLGR